MAAMAEDSQQKADSPAGKTPNVGQCSSESVNGVLDASNGDIILQHKQEKMRVQGSPSKQQMTDLVDGMNELQEAANAVENGAGELQSETSAELSADESAMRSGFPLYGDAIPNGRAKQTRVDGVDWAYSQDYVTKNSKVEKCPNSAARRRDRLPCHEAKKTYIQEHMKACQLAADNQDSCSGYKSLTIAIGWNACYCNRDTTDLKEDYRYATMMKSSYDQRVLQAKMEREGKMNRRRR